MCGDFFLGESMNKDNEFMELAYQEALKALEIDEVPIGAIIVQDGNIIAKSYNQREIEKQVKAHAEMLAIEQACRTLHSWRLDTCDIYVTLEPCLMCSGAIMQSRMQRVIFGAKSNRWLGLSNLIDTFSFNHYPIIIDGVLEEKCSKLLLQYFRNKRH